MARKLWGALWNSENRKNGISQHLLTENCVPVLFCTRREARAWIEKRFGFLKDRKDLRVWPHGWRLPKPVKVAVMWEKMTLGKEG